MKVKIKGTDILNLCNWKHEDFGKFVAFLSALMEDGYLIVDAEIYEEENKSKVK